MDWIDWHFWMAIGASALVLLMWAGDRALRSWWQRRSEPKPLYHGEQLAEDGESGPMMQHRMPNGHIRFHSAREPCGPACNPQPTSQPQSETVDDHSAGEPMFEGDPPPWYFKNPQVTSQPRSESTTGLTAGQLEQLGAKVDTDPEPRAWPENVD